MWYPAGWVITHLLVHSVQLQPLLQSSSEVAGRGGGAGKWVWGWSGTCILQGLISSGPFLNDAVFKLYQRNPCLRVSVLGAKEVRV